MTESQSRYSIVSDLTRIKLGIIDMQIELNDQIEKKQRDINIKTDIFSRWENSIQEDIKREAENRKSELGILDSELKSLVLSKKVKEEGFSKKIGEIDLALSKITDISKHATQ